MNHPPKSFLKKSILSIDINLNLVKSRKGILKCQPIQISKIDISYLISMFVFISRHFSFTNTDLQIKQNKTYFIRGVFTKFLDFFVQAFEIVIDSWKFSMLLLYMLWDDWPIFMISGSNEQLQQQLEYTLLKPDCHSWWISKMQSRREDNLEERYAIKLF